MNRTELNTIIRAGEEFIAQFNFALPPIAQWSPEKWRSMQGQLAEIVTPKLGWDITDFGSGDFKNVGLLLFTLRNGYVENLRNGRGKLFAEKILISRDGQRVPLHYHKLKTEDIIVRGGGKLVIKVFCTTPEGIIDAKSPVSVYTDGLRRDVVAGGEITLGAGESITVEAGIAHEIWAIDGDVLMGEVSTVNNDETDNFFIEPADRFPNIIEDTAPYRLMVSDYEKWI